MNVSRLFAIAANTLRELLRDRVLYLFALYTLIFVFCVRFIPMVSLGAGDQILLDIGLGLIHLLCVVLVILLGVSMVIKEFEKRTILVLMAKPASFSELLVGKHWGLVAVMGLLVLGLGSIYSGLLLVNGVAIPIGAIAVALLFLLLQLALLGAIALCLGTFLGTNLGLIIGYGIYVIGLLSQSLLSISKVSDNPALEKVCRVIYWTVPNLSRLNLQNDAVYGILPAADVLFASAIYGVLYTVMMLAIATLILSRRQF
ncbi:MAG: ABC transporter permease [Cyanobacteria bacterium P01_H01_bin.15]